MKWILVLPGIFFLTCFVQAQSYTDKLLKERETAQLEMLIEVLDSAERKTFEGICYFPIDTTFIVQARFERRKGKKFVMPMTKARTVWYRQYGVLHFTIHDTACSLIVYQNLDLIKDEEYKDYLFLPFRDGTTAVSTYGAGRYLDIRKSSGKNWTIDFNKAYHPYCAYSTRYSCPIVPAENTIDPHITAGECYVPHDE